jgi:hypothetical protein
MKRRLIMIGGLGLATALPAMATGGVANSGHRQHEVWAIDHSDLAGPTDDPLEIRDGRERERRHRGWPHNAEHIEWFGTETLQGLPPGTHSETGTVPSWR